MSGNPTRIAPPKFDQRNEQHTRSSVETRLRGSESTTENELRLYAATLTLVNGANANVTMPAVARFIRITGPSAAFSISGFTGGYEGKRIIVYNTTSQDMTLTNDATSTAANRLLTLRGADVTLPGVSMAHFIYSVSDLRWVLEDGDLDELLSEIAALSTDPNADSGLFFDDSAGSIAYFTPSAPLSFSGTTLICATASESAVGAVELATTAEASTGTDTARAVTPAGLTTFTQTWGHAPDVILEDQKSSGTAGGTSTGAARNTRTLNTAVRNLGSMATLSSNQFTLPAGTYWMEAWASSYRSGAVRVYIRNTSDSSDAAAGVNSFHNTGAGDTGGIDMVTGLVTIAGSKTFQVEHYIGNGVATNGLGVALSDGNLECYTKVHIWKVA